MPEFVTGLHPNHVTGIIVVVSVAIFTIYRINKKRDK